jgi:hypothetical protein
MQLAQVLPDTLNPNYRRINWKTFVCVECGWYHLTPAKKDTWCDECFYEYGNEVEYFENDDSDSESESSEESVCGECEGCGADCKDQGNESVIVFTHNNSGSFEDEYCLECFDTMYQFGDFDTCQFGDFDDDLQPTHEYCARGDLSYEKLKTVIIERHNFDNLRPEILASIVIEHHLKSILRAKN